MDKRVAGMALLALAIGASVLFVEAMLQGILASQAKPTPHEITYEMLMWRGLGRSALFAWVPPSALGAMLIARFEPKRWALYSACASLPMAIEFLSSVALTGSMHVLLFGLVDIALLPAFLWLFYASIRRRAAA